MNIYEMYINNGNKVGFWVKKNSWHNYVAKVVLINGKIEGSLPGRSPYFNNCSVLVDIYDLDTMELSKNWAGSPQNYSVGGGTYSFQPFEVN